MKETFYFSHDYAAASDLKLRGLMSEHGGIAYAIYFGIVELLHQETEHKLPMKKYIYSSISNLMVINDPDLVEKVIYSCINDYELFIESDGFFYSKRVNKNFEKRDEIKELRKEIGRKGGKASARKRLSKNSDKDETKQNEAKRSKTQAKVEQTQAKVEQNEAKPTKGKERKGKENKEKKKKGEGNNNIVLPYLENDGQLGDFEIDVGLMDEIKSVVPGLTDEIFKEQIIEARYWLNENPDERLREAKYMPRFLITWMKNKMNPRKNKKSSKNGNDTSAFEKYKSNRAKLEADLKGSDNA